EEHVERGTIIPDGRETVIETPDAPPMAPGALVLSKADREDLLKQIDDLGSAAMDQVAAPRDRRLGPAGAEPIILQPYRKALQLGGLDKEALRERDLDVDDTREAWLRVVLSRDGEVQTGKRVVITTAGGAHRFAQVREEDLDGDLLRVEILSGANAGETHPE